MLLFLSYFCLVFSNFYFCFFSKKQFTAERIVRHAGNKGEIAGLVAADLIVDVYKINYSLKEKNPVDHVCNQPHLNFIQHYKNLRTCACYTDYILSRRNIMLIMYAANYTWSRFYILTNFAHVRVLHGLYSLKEKNPVDHVCSQLHLEFIYNFHFHYCRDLNSLVENIITKYDTALYS